MASHGLTSRGDRLPRTAPARPTLFQEDTISSEKAQSWVYSEGYLPEDDTLLRARERAGQLGCTPVLPGSGAVLRVLAAVAQARAVVEIGTGTGVASLYLLRGMPDDGVLTTIDVEVEHQRAAKEAFGSQRASRDSSSAYRSPTANVSTAAVATS